MSQKLYFLIKLYHNEKFLNVVQGAGMGGWTRKTFSKYGTEGWCGPQFG
jgi:hypothetical protein